MNNFFPSYIEGISLYGIIMMNLVFLHGLLGTKSDWQKVIENLPHFRCFSLDLPFHGENKAVAVEDFEQTAQCLEEQIQHLIKNEPYILIGYSLGGRIAQYYALQARVKIGHLKAVILEGANLGLQSEQEKQSRLVNDNMWAERFFHEKPETVLEDWYQQPVFSHLNEQQRKALLEKRKANCGANIGHMLLATSLAKQPDFREKVRSSLLPFFYFCGERDQKFRQMAEDNQLDLTIIPDAGHNAHLENPTYFAEKIENIVLKIAQP